MTYDPYRGRFKKVMSRINRTYAAQTIDAEWD